MLTWDMSRAKIWFEDANGVVSGECSQHHLYRIVKYSTFSGHPVARVFFQEQEEPSLLMFMNRLVREDVCEKLGRSPFCQVRLSRLSYWYTRRK